MSSPSPNINLTFVYSIQMGLVMYSNLQVQPNSLLGLLDVSKTKSTSISCQVEIGNELRSHRHASPSKSYNISFRFSFCRYWMTKIRVQKLDTATSQVSSIRISFAVERPGGCPWKRQRLHHRCSQLGACVSKEAKGWTWC